MVMEKLRNSTKLILWIVVFAFVGWLFFQLGARISGQRKLKPWQKGIIAEIEGIKIDYKNFEARVNYAIQETLALRENKNLTEDEIKRIRETEFNKLLEDIRWAKFTQQKRKMNIQDGTIYQIILRNPPPEIRNDTSFYTDGQFDYEKYKQVLQDPRAQQYFAAYAYKIKLQIPKEWTIEDIIAALDFSDAELWDIYKRENTSVKVKYLAIFTREIPDSLISLNDEDIKKYYNKHKEKFKEQPKAALKLVQFEIKPTIDDTLTIRDRLETALEILKEGGEFEELIKDYSEDDGDFGWIKKDDRRTGELFEKLKDKNTGEVVGPITYGRGMYLFKIEKKTGDSIKVKDIFVAIAPSEATKQDVYEKAKEFVNVAKKKGFEEAAKEFNLKILDTGEFSQEAIFIPYIGFKNPVVKHFIKTSNEGEISDVFNLNNRYLVLYLYKKQGERIPAFNEDNIKEKAKKLYILSEKLRIVKENLNRADSLIKSGVLMDSVPGKLMVKAHVAETGYFKWKTPADKIIGYNPEFNGVAFSLKPGLVSKPFITEPHGGFIIKCLDKKEPTKEDFERNKVQLVQRLKSEMLNYIFREWQEDFFSLEDIKDYRNYIYIY